MRAVRVSGAVFALMFGLVVSAFAQNASLVLRVVDPDRAAVANAPIVLVPPSGAQRTALTGNDGTFEFTGLAPGDYRVEIVAPGFNLFSETVTVAAGTRTVDAALTVAGVSEDVTVLGEATVPAIGRINSPLKDQPLTVNTITSEFIQQHALNDVVSALNYVSNVSAYSQYGVYQYFSFRGFADNVQMVDGIRNEGNRVNTQLANVDRLEVLKGPASVLYGGDAVGATVNLVLKKPSAEPVYDYSAAAGRWDTYRGAFGAGGRIINSNSLFYRLDVGGESADNFRHDASKRLNVTPSITWKLSNSSLIDVRHMYDRVRVSADAGIPLVPLSGGFVPDPTRSAIGDPIGRAVAGDGSDFIPKVPRDVRYNSPQDFGMSNDQNLRVSFTQTLGQSVALRNTFGYRNFADEYWETEFLDVTPPSRVNRGFLYFEHHRAPWTNQLELSGQAKLGVNHGFLIGWDHQDYSNYTDRRALANYNTTPLDLYNPVETHKDVDVHGFPVTRRDYFDQNTEGIFLQDTMTIVPQLKVVVGGRYDTVDRSAHNNPVSAAGVESAGPLTKGASERGTYRAGVVYQPTGNVDLYVQNSTAFRPNFNVQADGTPLKPEFGELVEAGQRLRLVNNRIEISAAVFNVEKRNVARSIGGGNFDQIGKIRSRGFETELHGRLTPAWSADFGYGLSNAKFASYFTNAGVNLSGKIPRRAPKHTMSFSTSYSWRGFAITGGGQVVSKQFINDTDTVGFNGYELLHAGISYRRGPVQYGLNLTNLTDREYFASSLGNRQLYPGQPFNLMATIRIHTN